MPRRFLAALLLVAACGGPAPRASGADGGEAGDAGAGTDGGGDDAGQPAPVALRLVWVHGVQTGSARLTAEDDLGDLDAYVRLQAPARISRWAQANPGRQLSLVTSRVNLYRAGDGGLVEPGIDSTSDGTGKATAGAWRSQLAHALERELGAGEVAVLVGHSTGAKVSLELAADVGPDGGLASGTWTVAPRIGAVVTLHGIVDALQSSAYDVAGPTSYVTGCKAAQAPGFCEYSGLVSAVPAANWVATHKRALLLVSWGNCSPSGWAGQNDKSVPVAAQGAPLAPGMFTTPAPGTTWAPAHGVLYGSFCHSDPVSPGAANHEQAVIAAGERILTFLFERADRVVELRSAQTTALAADTFSPLYALDGGCGAELDWERPEVVGLCRHPGSFDGDDHPMNAQNFVEVNDTGSCGGSARWQHLHPGESHAGQLWIKAYATTDGGVAALH